jgi:hypothetical protein
MPKTALGLHYEVTDLQPAWSRLGRGGRPVIFHHGVGASWRYSTSGCQLSPPVIP